MFKSFNYVRGASLSVVDRAWASVMPSTMLPAWRRHLARYDRGLSDLVGELSTRSAEFRTRWAAHNVRFHRTSAKRLHHPVVGDLELFYETMELSADAGLNLTIYTAEAGSSAQQALDLLASWTATLDEAAAASVSDDAESR